MTIHPSPIKAAGSFGNYGSNFPRLLATNTTAR
jgi:hypothetical protein